MCYENEAANMVEYIVERTEDIYEYITVQIGDDEKDCNEYLISVSDCGRFYKCEICGDEGTIIDWHMKYFDTSFSCAFQSINQYFGLNLLTYFPEKEIKKFMEFAEENHSNLSKY